MVDRRLAAILIADVVGYSRLMEADEAGTFNALTERRNTILQPLAKRHQGRIIKFMGDGVLMEFASAVSAVACAVDLQHDMARANEGIDANKHLSLRIGVNLGDVIIEGNDLYGDGVNIAARLEQIAETGGICVSESVYRQVKGKIAETFESVGFRRLKNIKDPVSVYRVCPAGMPAYRAETLQTANDRASIAVLPFDNMSGDPEQSYFSDGITEDIITELSKFKELRVTARNSSFQFRGQSADMSEVARKLGVAFVLEGSVRKVGNRIRVTAQLIEAGSASHVWAERFDRELTDVFAIQDEIASAITARVAGTSQTVLAARSRTRPTNSLSAYDYYLRARVLFINYDTSLESIPLLERASELDPDFAIPHAMLCDAYCFLHGRDGRHEHLDRAIHSARNALSLDPNEPWANYAMALALTRFGKLEEAGHFHARAFDLNSNDAYMIAVYASWLVRMCRFDDSLAMIDLALRRDPYAYDWFWDVRAGGLAAAGRYVEAVECFRRMRSATEIPPLMYCFRAICFTELGQVEAASLAVKKCREFGRSPEEVFGEETFADPAVFDRLMHSLRKAVLSAGP